MVLHEVFYVHKFIGIIFTVLAGSLLTFSKTEIHSKIGVLYAIGATVTFAFVILFYAPLLYAFNAPTLTFFIFLIPACINAVIMPDARHRIPALLSTHTYMVLAAGVAGGLANIGMNSALMTGNATQTLVIVESFLIVTLVGEHIVLKEKKGVVKKIISVLLAVAGALLIKIT